MTTPLLTGEISPGVQDYLLHYEDGGGYHYAVYELTPTGGAAFDEFADTAYLMPARPGIALSGSADGGQRVPYPSVLNGLEIVTRYRGGRGEFVPEFYFRPDFFSPKVFFLGDGDEVMRFSGETLEIRSMFTAQRIRISVNGEVVLDVAPEELDWPQGVPQFYWVFAVMLLYDPYEQEAVPVSADPPSLYFSKESILHPYLYEVHQPGAGKSSFFTDFVRSFELP